MKSRPGRVLIGTRAIQNRLLNLRANGPTHQVSTFAAIKTAIASNALNSGVSSHLETIMPYEELDQRTAAALEALAAQTNGMAPIQVADWEINIHAYGDGAELPSVVADVRDWANATSFIYLFELLQPQDPQRAVNSFALAKAQGRDGRSYSRLNGPAKILYVGGSAAIATRLKQHLGYGPKGTYSMHLAHWAHEIDATVRFSCAGFGPVDNPDVLQSMEDQLWAESAPMLGRRGRR